MWYAKMYFSGEKEFFENDAFGMQGLPSKQLELPFLESLLTFLELDEKEITPMLERISVNWEHFVESSDLGAHTAAMVELGMLAEKHRLCLFVFQRQIPMAHTAAKDTCHEIFCKPIDIVRLLV